MNYYRLQMKHRLYLLVLIITLFQSIQSQCSGGIWPIQDTNIGSFTISWRYNMASNTVQFIIEGKAIDSINLASTYIALGWSDTAPTMNNMDVAMYFLGTQIVQDRYSRSHAVPTIDNQQDFCVIRTNATDKNIYVAFERFVTTGDSNDISFISNLYLMFSIGSYTFTNSYNPQQHFYRIPYQTSINLISCISNGCLTTSCLIPSCPCLQQITTGSAQCVCFPPSSCISGSTITPRTTTTSIPVGIQPVSTSITGSCQNQTNPCSSNGICIQTSTTQYTCQCKNNYTGVFCQTTLGENNIILANLCQCQNGGTCLANGTCLCSSLFRGKFCQINNPCITYCRNNGACSVACTDTTCATPVCTCGSDSTGVQCETTVDGPCQTSTCLSGNCVTLSNGTTQCQCNSGYFGSRCNLINSCLSNPCNQGTCLASSNCQGVLCSYSCLCPTGITGTNCENGNNPCVSNPCQNKGTCQQSANRYTCKCALPYGGTHCDLIINVCTPNPCFNNGECVRSSDIQDGTYRCNCQNGFIGASCEYVSGCISSPCRNGGQCISSTTNCSLTTCPASCKCLNGTTGVYCEQQSISCLTQSCLNGGICSTNPTTNISYCQCLSNTTGVRCETIVPICTNTTCSNNGVCYIDASGGNNLLRCICLSGYAGQNCEISINSLNLCSSNPCGYNGTCIPTSNSSYYCMCSNGAAGSSCSLTTLTSCDNSPCHYLATCQPITNSVPKSYECICPDYLTGDRCQYVNNCQKQPCYNQGTCIPLGPQNNFMCLCQRGFGHYDCSIYLGLSCSATVCLNGGTCDFNSTNIRCICPSGFTGARCEWNSVCSSDTCLNGGTCRQTAATMAECLCPNGFTGPTCGLRDSCVNFPCKNGAACTTLLTETGNNWSAYRCVCPPGRFGENCDTPITSCASILCPTNKICSEQATGPVCTCSGNKVGTFCQYENPCAVSSSVFCQNGGTCVSSNTDPPIASCLCRTGFTGSQCNTIIQNDPCGSSPCENRGYCALSMSNATFSCICRSNYTGSQCERTNPCVSSPCLNGAVCQSQWNTKNTWFTCSCVETFTGTRCETSLLNPCGGLCMNGSPCVNGVCVCPEQYLGTYCGYTNPCQSSICRNGGLCVSIYNSTGVSFTCTCPPQYTGQYCETYLVAQTSNACILPCYNGGSCVNGLCMCTSQYVGPSCQYENPCIKNNPCLNSGTCFGRYHLNGTLYTQCFCLQGYTGTNCEASICSLTSCNGGNCTAVQNTFICSCPTGKVGDRCQYTDVCASNPCPSTERCEQNGSIYQCVSCYDKSIYCSMYQNRREYCTNLYAILINDSYYSTLEACPLSCGQCVATQNLSDRSSDVIIENDESYTSEFTTTTSSSSTTTVSRPNIIFSREEKCIDRLQNCAEQKALGFCGILNAKYPDDCAETCHPVCKTNF